MSKKSGTIIWLTGLSGSGKTTISVALKNSLSLIRKKVIILDGDIMRAGLCSDLKFSINDRVENIRRVGEVAKIVADEGIIVVAAFISPLREGRANIRESAITRGIDFVEVFVDCPIQVCEKRDVKGLYKRARSNELKEFTGITSPYESPLDPEVYLDTNLNPVSKCVGSIIEYLAVSIL